MITLSKFPRSVNSVNLDDFNHRLKKNSNINEIYITYTCSYTYHQEENDQIKGTLFWNWSVVLLTTKNSKSLYPCEVQAIREFVECNPDQREITLYKIKSIHKY